MRLHVLSDLHLEFEPLEPTSARADVVVLAGDIHTGLRGLDFAKRLALGRPAIYVAGNHEYYGHVIPHLTRKLEAAASRTSVRFLENQATVVDGTRFLGCTLWTDFAIHGPERAGEAMTAAERQITDYFGIRKGPLHRRLHAVDTVRWHARSRRWLREMLHTPFDGPTVVVTHHAPTPRSSHPHYADDLLTTAFVSDLGDLVRGDLARLWIHGHTHHCVDFELNGTRVVSNQRGYPGEQTHGFDPDLVVEV